MRQLTVILLIPLVLSPVLSRTWTLVSFKIHQDFIARVLCINKDIPEVMCNGTCYLKQLLAEDEQQEEAPLASAKKFELIYLVGGKNLHKAASVLKDTACIPYLPRAIVCDYLEPVFHPPVSA